MSISRILHLIEITGVSPKALTTETGLSGSAITEWKKGKAKPSTDAIVKISNYFSVPIEYILELGVFSNWDEITSNKDAIWNALGESPYRNAYLTTEDGKSLRSLFYDAMYTEPDDLVMIKLFSWAVKSVTFIHHTSRGSGQERIDANLEFSDVLLFLLPKEASKGSRRMTMGEGLQDFGERQRNGPVYALSEDERRLLDVYRGLSDLQKGEVFRTIMEVAAKKN